MRIIYTPKAKRDLSNILNYYHSIKRLKKGRKIRAKLILRAAELRNFSRLGKKDIDFTLADEMLCRELVCDNYKIVYHIEEKDKIVVVLRFYDTRQG